MLSLSVAYWHVGQNLFYWDCSNLNYTKRVVICFSFNYICKDILSSILNENIPNKQNLLNILFVNCLINY